MININELSKSYFVRKLKEDDIDLLLELCNGNTLFYKYTNAKPEIDVLIQDMKRTPNGVSIDDKYFIGFFNEDELVCVMDLIDGYPNDDIVYIGFFMMNIKYQGKGIGSKIISDVIDYFKKTKKEAIRLAIDDGNPQSNHFWKKNGFIVIYEVNLDGWIKRVAERKLY